MEETQNVAPAGKKEKRIPVVELFGPTIEGEGELIGMQTLFIRFGLCDYKCQKCDSMHAVDPGLVKLLAGWHTQQELADNLLAYRKQKKCEHINNVTFSGGNPAIHDLTELVHILHAEGIKVYVETQGTKSPKWLSEVDHIVVSPKSPGMGENFDPKVFVEFLMKVLYPDTGHAPKMSIKIVVFSAQDLEFAAGVFDLCSQKVIREIGFDIRDHFYLSLGNPFPPAFRAVVDEFDGKGAVTQDDTDGKALALQLLRSYNQLSEEIMQDRRLRYAKFLPQLHVLAWGNETGK